MAAYDVSLFLYNITLIPMIFFSLLFIIISGVNLLSTARKQHYPALKGSPFVSVHIPTFNDPVAARCIEHCLALDYPKDKYEIIIADDSTNIETQKLLKKYTKHSNVKYLHRKNRSGYKPGALKEAMPHTKGEFIVLFDSDWQPAPDFLKKALRPFANPEIAVVQCRQGFYNRETNLITRFASYLLMIHHAVIMPIANRVNAVFLGGTAGVIRRSAFDKVGGWNLESITEDADLTVRLLLAGYKTAYLEHATPSEVPDTLESFLKQQMRWCYGNVRVFLDHAASILFSRKLSLGQRFVISYITMGNIVAPIVVGMTIFGFAGWFLGEPSLFNWSDVITMLSRVLLTAGFFVLGAIALRRWKTLNEFKYLVVSAVSIGLMLAVANSVAFVKAIANRPLSWYCTPKVENAAALR